MDETLAQVLLGLKAGAPVSHGLLHIFPLRGCTGEENDIWLLQDALWAGTVRIEGLHEDRGAPELCVVNEGALRVLILEGDEIAGARQNRVVNTSVLVDAGSEIVLPVSCVERGRWSHRPQAFFPQTGGQHPALRRLTSRFAYDSPRRGRGHRSDYRGAWREVDHRPDLQRVASSTYALRDSRSPHPTGRSDAFGKLARELPDGTSGVVVAIGERLALLEVLAGPCTFARVFRKLLSGYALESVGLDRPYGTPDAPAVEGFIEAVAQSAYDENRAVGSGRDLQLEAEGISGYALVGERGVLHAAAFAE